jgi:hypothetical protein
MKATIALAVLASVASMAAAAPAGGFTPAISFATPEHARTSRAAKKVHYRLRIVAAYNTASAGV